jgi:hypothetical protein
VRVRAKKKSIDIHRFYRFTSSKICRLADSTTQFAAPGYECLYLRHNVESDPQALRQESELKFRSEHQVETHIQLQGNSGKWLAITIDNRYPAARKMTASFSAGVIDNCPRLSLFRLQSSWPQKSPENFLSSPRLFSP